MNAKIIATIGPKSEDYNTLKAMAQKGLVMARINFSHANYPQYNRLKRHLNKINKEEGREIKIIFDLQGPRIRVGQLKSEGLEIVEGEVYTFIPEGAETSGQEIPIDDFKIINDLKLGDPIFLDNGIMEMSVIKKDLLKKKFLAKTERGGRLFSRKGVNLPKTVLKRDILTAKDLLDIEFLKKAKPDYVAVSFVQNSDDILKIKKIINNSKIKIIAKIERGTALDDIDKIIRYSDCLMIARGDLGIEIPLEDLPVIQKNLIRHAHWHNTPAIVATQMMASMVNYHHPTRAEVSDVANAVFDGADALMLSDETAVGNYPIETIEIMDKIIKKTNQCFGYRNYFEK